MAFSLFVVDPIFYTYSVLVTVYVVTRFVLSPFYRPTPDCGFRPTLSIIIPAFNEGEVVRATVDACYSAEYPQDRIQVVVIDDGSSDDTWEHILLSRERHPTLLACRFSHNRGKRAAMAEGIRRSTGRVIVFIDSDSVIEPDGLAQIVQGFLDPRVGGVVGTAEVINKTENWITRMQQVRYYVAFQVIKGSESIFGAVTCASGCFSAYRREALLAILDRWENQRFLGKPATYGDDRALTNYVLRDWRITYQSTAKSHTLAPATLHRFLVQQARWKKSWLRESLHVSRFIWKKHPVAAAAHLSRRLLPVGCAARRVPLALLPRDFREHAALLPDGRIRDGDSLFAVLRDPAALATLVERRHVHPALHAVPGLADVLRPRDASQHELGHTRDRAPRR